MELGTGVVSVCLIWGGALSSGKPLLFILIKFAPSARPTVSQSPLSLPPLGFIVSSLARKGKTWPKLPNRCQRYVLLKMLLHMDLDVDT